MAAHIHLTIAKSLFYYIFIELFDFELVIRNFFYWVYTQDRVYLYNCIVHKSFVRILVHRQAGAHLLYAFSAAVDGVENGVMTQDWSW